MLDSLRLCVIGDRASLGAGQACINESVLMTPIADHVVLIDAEHHGVDSPPGGPHDRGVD
jgi:hypothetical protein